MGEPWGGVKLSEALRRRVIERVPFPEAVLGDRDDPMGCQLHFLAEAGGRRLYVFNQGGVLWATVRDGVVVGVQILEGRKAQRVYRAHVLALPPDHAELILTSLRVGRDAGEGLREVFGDRLHALTDLTESSRQGRSVYAWLVNHGPPKRQAVLELEVDAQGRIAAVDLMQGKRAARYLDNLP